MLFYILLLGRGSHWLSYSPMHDLWSGEKMRDLTEFAPREYKASRVSLYAWVQHPPLLVFREAASLYPGRQQKILQQTWAP